MNKNKTKKLFALLLAVCLFACCVTSAYAASGTCEVFYFTYASSVGPGGSATIQSCLNDLGYTANRYADTHAYYVRRTMDSDKVFAIVSHGAPGRVFCQSGITTMSANAVNWDDDNYSLAAWFGQDSLSGLLFAYYGACESAVTSTTYGNLPEYTTGTMGASCSLGFDESVYNTQATYYEGKLFEYLKSGYSVSTSNILARTSTYSQYSDYGNVDSAVIYGDRYTYIN